MSGFENTEILRQSCGPIAWMKGRSPHRAIIDRRVVIASGDCLQVLDTTVPSRFLHPHQTHLPFEDPVIQKLSERLSALRSLTDGGLWEGLLTSITGQAVSLASAAAFQQRLCAMLSPAITDHTRTYWSLPTAEAVAGSTAEQLKTIGLTGRRAEGLHLVATTVADGGISDVYEDNVTEWMRALRELPMVGPWTAASSLLWGVGHQDVYPPGDVALLRAARYAYNNDGLTMKELNALAEGWAPQRGLAARLLWTNLLGTAW